MINCSKIVYVLTDETRKTLHPSELETTLAIEAHFYEWEDIQQEDFLKFDLAALECENDSYEEFITRYDELLEQHRLPFSRFILVSKQPLTVDLSHAWQLGLHCHVCISNVENVYHAIENFCRLINENRRLDQQLHEASDIAVLSMSSSSQLGEIIRFLEKSYHCKSYERLAEFLSEVLETLGITGCGIIKTEKESIYFGDTDRARFWKRILKEHEDKGRSFDIENRTIINFESISVLGRNLPDPGSEEHGRLKDALFKLIEGAEARIKSITAERQAQIAEKAKASFLALMSHELRTPLNSILGFTALLSRKEEGDTLSQRDLDALQLTDESSQRLMSMISDILDLSHISTNAENEKHRLVLKDVLHTAISEAEKAAIEKGLQFTSTFHEISLSADVDQKRISQIIKQLLSNAVKFTETGSVSFDARSKQDKNKGDLLEIKVSDTGVGFDEEQHNLFKPFEIGEDYLTRKQNGLGLGLALVSQFVREMSGDIKLESKKGDGSTFILTFPQYNKQND